MSSLDSTVPCYKKLHNRYVLPSCCIIIICSWPFLIKPPEAIYDAISTGFYFILHSYQLVRSGFFPIYSILKNKKTKKIFPVILDGERRGTEVKRSSSNCSNVMNLPVPGYLYNKEERAVTLLLFFKYLF